MIRTVPARPLVRWPEDEEPRFEKLGDAVDRLSPLSGPWYVASYFLQRGKAYGVGSSSTGRSLLGDA